MSEPAMRTGEKVDETPLTGDRPVYGPFPGLMSLYPGEVVMITYTSSTREGPFLALVKMVRWVRESRDRRLLRDWQQRNEWIDEARNAPTVQAWMDGHGR